MKLLILTILIFALIASTALAQEGIILYKAHAPHAAPSRGSAKLTVVSALRPITGERTVLPVLAHHGNWIKVRLPGRPNSGAGWIATYATSIKNLPYNIVVSRSARRIKVFNNHRLVYSSLAVVGKPSTPTPRGHFFVEENVALSKYDSGAPYALALSARSNVFQEFEGGPGQIAIHGLRNIGGTPGRAESHGCIRLRDSAIKWLAYRIDPGTPVTVN